MNLLIHVQLTKSVCDVCNLLKDKYGENTKIIVKDGHWTGRNILYEYMPSGVTLVTNNTVIAKNNYGGSISSRSVIDIYTVLI